MTNTSFFRINSTQFFKKSKFLIPMPATFTINSSKVHVKWDEQQLRSKLTAIGKLNGKSYVWIQSDLSIKKFNWLTRLIWNAIAKHFIWMRKHLYGVDLKKSRKLLLKIGTNFGNNWELKTLYQTAVAKFNQIAPEYSINPVVAKCNSDHQASMKFQELDTKEKILEFVKINGKELVSLHLFKIRDIRNEDIETFLNYCPKLINLYIDSWKTNDNVLSIISTFPLIKKLGLANCHLTDRGLHRLERLEQLEEINFWNCKFSEAGLVHLQKLTKLRKLSLSWNCLTNSSLKHLQYLTKLEDLSLSFSSLLSDNGLEHLKNLCGLKKFKISCCNIHDDGLKHLKALTNLEMLVIDGCSIKGYGLKHLKTLPQLKKLKVQSDVISEDGLKPLEELHQLEELDLTSCNITDTHLEYLYPLHQLKELQLWNCKNITADSIQALQEKLPNLLTII